MTEHLTPEQARALGYLRPQEAPGSRAPGRTTQRPVCPGCKRTGALLALLRTLLDEGYEVRLEHRFQPPRKWRFDVALLDCKVALEIEGGSFLPGGGAHQRPGRFLSDMEKYNAAQALGWRVLRATWEHVASGEALVVLERTIREAS